MRPLWLRRPLLNWHDVYEWAPRAGIKKMMPPEELHVTLATVREPCDWSDLELQTDLMVIPAGLKAVQIFGFTAKALAFGHPALKERHETLLERFPQMDHPLLRPHVTLFRGGKMPRELYEGELIFGPEEASEFDEQKARDIKHIKVSDYLDRARERCKAEGMDPEFVGSKGYPNWRDFTDQSINRTREFVAETQQMMAECGDAKLLD